jgi:signal transduction histidine kinase
MASVLALRYQDLQRGWLAVVLVAGALAYTILATVWLRHGTPRLLGPPAVVSELVLATALVLGDGFAYPPGHAFSISPPLGSVWPLVSVLSAGVAFGAAWGVSAGVVLGLARLGATLANGVRDLHGGQVISLVGTGLFYAVAGAVAGYVAWLLRGAEREISAARAREEVARTLHDGVLQTLAVVERRSTDPDLVRLAREQDRELRRYLFGDTTDGDGGSDLGAALRAAAARFEATFAVPVAVLVADDLPKLRRRQVEALSGAVSEALANAGKHAGARRLTVFVEPDDDGGLFCSVKDDGAGFDMVATAPGVGIDRSIVARMAEVGGRAEVRSHPGHGTEVCLWLRDDPRWCWPTIIRSGATECGRTSGATSGSSGRPEAPGRPSR